jgi:hypothetical protein
MAVALIQEFRIENGDKSTTNYDAVSEQVNAAGDWPDGAIIHTAGFDDEAGVFRIFEVWESREQCERFLEGRVMPIVMGLGRDAPPPQRQEIYELHGYVTR